MKLSGFIYPSVLIYARCAEDNHFICCTVSCKHQMDIDSSNCRSDYWGGSCWPDVILAVTRSVRLLCLLDSVLSLVSCNDELNLAWPCFVKNYRRGRDYLFVLG